MQLDTPYAGETNVLHFLEVLRDKVGFDALKKAAVNPLTGKKIGAYYGCLLLRPGKVIFGSYMKYSSPVILNETLWGLGISMQAVVFGRMGESVKRAGSEYEWLDNGQKVTIKGNLP